MYGYSYNRFEAPDEAEEQKDFFSIDFENRTTALGFSSVAVRPKGRFDFGVSVSTAYADRRQRQSDQFNLFFDSDLYQTVINSQYSYERFLTPRSSLRFGLDLLVQENDFGFRSTTNGRGNFFYEFSFLADAMPYLAFTKLFRHGSLYLAVRGGLQASDFEDRWLALPRLRYTGKWGAGRIVANVEAVSGFAIIDPPSTASDDNDYGVTWRGSLAYDSKLGRFSTRATVFLSYTDKEAATQVGNFLYSANNLLEIDPSLRFRSLTATRRYGIELEAASGTRASGWYYRGNLTLLNAETYQPDDTWARDRYAVDYIAKVTLGREWPGVGKRARPRVWGLNLALIAHGGERAGRVVPPGGDRVPDYFTPQDFSSGFSERYGTYFRPDLRLYLTKPREKRTTTLALDFQNAAGVRNVQARYYDTFLERPEERTSLGLIPVLSYRIAWHPPGR